MNNKFFFDIKFGANLLQTATLISCSFFISRQYGDNHSSFILTFSGAIGKSLCSSWKFSG